MILLFCLLLAVVAMLADGFRRARRRRRFLRDFDDFLRHYPHHRHERDGLEREAYRHWQRYDHDRS